ncbi:hypothetical protein INR49_019739 [Caranx melampygus]|nr:hypothetical protein INR49_019739 [Caranx melampygus]
MEGVVLHKKRLLIPTTPTPPTELHNCTTPPRCQCGAPGSGETSAPSAGSTGNCRQRLRNSCSVPVERRTCGADGPEAA